MGTLARHVSNLEKALLLAIKHPSDTGIGVNALMAMEAHHKLVDNAMRDNFTAVRQHSSDISVLVNFAGTLGRFFKLAVVRDKLGDEMGQPPPLTIATFGLTTIFSNILFTISKSGNIPVQKLLFKQVCTMLDTYT